MSQPPWRAQQQQGSLVAVLANPPLKSESRSRGRIELAASLLGYDDVVIVNLFAHPSRSSKDIAILGVDPEGWKDARGPLLDGLVSSDGVLIGFGAIPATGLARLHLRNQLTWLAEQLDIYGHGQVWQVGDARHPSRWHQYVSDRHGRTAGGSFEQRLHQVLIPTLIADLPWAVIDASSPDSPTRLTEPTK